MKRLNRWRDREELVEGRLRVWSFGKAGRWLLLLMTGVAGGLAALGAEDNEQLLSVTAFMLPAVLIMYRFAWSRLDVDAAGMTYFGLMGRRCFAWADVAGFLTGADGITVVSHASKETWLVATKREAFTSRRMAAKADALLARVVLYAPDPSEYGPIDEKG